MSRIAYYRVSTGDQHVDAQRQALGGQFDKEFTDEGVSGATPAATRPAFAKLLSYVREGDTIYVYALDRLGRDAPRRPGHGPQIAGHGRHARRPRSRADRSRCWRTHCRCAGPDCRHGTHAHQGAM